MPKSLDDSSKAASMIWKGFEGDGEEEVSEQAGLDVGAGFDCLTLFLSLPNHELSHERLPRDEADRSAKDEKERNDEGSSRFEVGSKRKVDSNSEFMARRGDEVGGGPAKVGAGEEELLVDGAELLGWPNRQARSYRKTCSLRLLLCDDVVIISSLSC